MSAHKNIVDYFYSKLGRIEYSPEKGLILMYTFEHYFLTHLPVLGLKIIAPLKHLILRHLPVFKLSFLPTGHNFKDFLTTAAERGVHL